MDIVARLGGFHTLMSYLGAIGKVMKGFRIEELFNEVYAENTVQHILKAVSRALRAHLLPESALYSILFEDTEAVNIAEVNEFVSILQKKSLENIETFCQTPEVRELEGAVLEKRMQELREIMNCKILASVLVLYSSIEEIHYCQKNIQLVTSPTVNYRYSESLPWIWASTFCQKCSSLCSANDVPARKSSLASWTIWKWKARIPKKPAILGRSLFRPLHAQPLKITLTGKGLKTG